MLARCAFALLVWPLCALDAHASNSGSIFILDRFGNHVQANTFDRLDAPTLSGGRVAACGVAGCVGPGLTDGDYYFEITDPAGTELLTPDPISERRVRVTGGILSDYLGSTRLFSHGGPCGALQLRLLPYAITPTKGGEYKVWMTRVEDYDPLGTHLFGFDPALCKSDNFRVAASRKGTIVRGYKFYDHDANGSWNALLDPLEVPIGGWRVELRSNDVLAGVTFTDQDGAYIFIRDLDAAPLELREVSPNGFINDATPGATWLATTPRSGFVMTSAECVAGPEFGNVDYELTVGVGRTVEDWVSQGDEDDGDDADDDDDQEGHNGGQGADHGDDGDDGDDDCQGTDDDPPTGRELLEDCDPQWRQTLTTRHGLPIDLRRPISSALDSVSVFAPPSNTGFGHAFHLWRTYARSNAHDHAGFLLSREVAATLLSTTCGSMQGSIYIDRFHDGVLVSLDTMLDGAIGLLTQTGAGQTGPNDPYQDLRHMMQMCTNEFGGINDTGDPFALQVVYRKGDAPKKVEAPYESPSGD